MPAEAKPTGKTVKMIEDDLKAHIHMYPWLAEISIVVIAHKEEHSVYRCGALEEHFRTELRYSGFLGKEIDDLSGYLLECYLRNIHLKCSEPEFKFAWYFGGDLLYDGVGEGLTCSTGFANQPMYGTDRGDIAEYYVKQIWELVHQEGYLAELKREEGEAKQKAEAAERKKREDADRADAEKIQRRKQFEKLKAEFEPAS